MGKYVTKECLGGNNYIYKRTRQTFTPKQEKVKPNLKDKTSDVLIEDVIDIAPTLPYARVVRLLQKPLPSAPKPKRRQGHMYSGIQSGMGLFDGF